MWELTVTEFGPCLHQCSSGGIRGMLCIISLQEVKKLVREVMNGWGGCVCAHLMVAVRQIVPCFG